MKKIILATAALTASLSSASASAHVGEHGDMGLMAGALHLMTDHGYLLALIALVAGALVLQRAYRS